MEILALSLLILSCIIGTIAILFTNFGTLIILLGSALYAWMTGFTSLPWQGLAWILVLYLIGETLEFFLVVLSARRFGASYIGILGALVGGALGTILGPAVLGLGALVGGLFGIFLGGFLVEHIRQGDTSAAIKAGIGGLLGRLGAIVLKGFIALSMFICLAIYLLR